MDNLNFYFTFLLLSFFTISGLLIIYGTYKKWKWIVDPSAKYSNADSQVIIKKWFGKKFLIVYSYIVGFAFFLFGFIELIDLFR